MGETSSVFLNKKLSTALAVTETTDAVVDGTNPHGDTSVMLVVMRVKVDTPTLQDKAVATVKSYHDTQPGSEQALTQALAQVGPVSVAIDASASTFRRCRQGVHYSRSCSSRRLNHAVLAVGFGSEGGRDYFLVKNSWGTRWGAGGYIKMARNMRNNCGIASKPSFPIV